VLAVFSHFYLHEAMHGLDWVGVAMAAMGTVAVGATGEGQKKGHISVIRLLLFFSWLALFFVWNFPWSAILLLKLGSKFLALSLVHLMQT
jgi:hypothetical protein